VRFYIIRNLDNNRDTKKLIENGTKKLIENGTKKLIENGTYENTVVLLTRANSIPWGNWQQHLKNIPRGSHSESIRGVVLLFY
jgi:hypothetical protein